MGGSMQLKTAIENFLSGYFSTCRRSAKTVSAYKMDLDQFQTYVGDISLIQIGSETIESWAKELETRGYVPVSIRRKCATLRVFFGYWVRKGQVMNSPFWKIRLDLGRRPDLPRNLTASDAKLL